MTTYKKHQRVKLLCGWLITGLLSAATSAEQSASSGSRLATLILSSISAVEYSRKGADTCIKCHDETAEFPVFDIFKTKHALQADEDTPFAGLQCEACHGPGVNAAAFMEQALASGSHVGRVRPGEKRPPIINFGKKSDEPPQVQNAMCLNCHEGQNHFQWQDSAHQFSDLSCADCHVVHTAQDPILKKTTQAQQCFACHKQQRADFSKRSHHPVSVRMFAFEGNMACSDCHASHGSATEFSLLGSSINETCFSCHSEKRGPFLWEHAPVAEDCTFCHNAHGSNHPALLTRRTPFLCRECHSQRGHPSIAPSREGLAGKQPSAFMLSGACLNCHSQVHGSNHPSGAKGMR